MPIPIFDALGRFEHHNTLPKPFLPDTDLHTICQPDPRHLYPPYYAAVVISSKRCQKYVIKIISKPSANILDIGKWLIYKVFFAGLSSGKYRS